MVGEALGDTLVEKLVGGLLLCVVGAFLMAPGPRRRRRVVAVALVLALLAALRRAGDAVASTRRDRPRAPAASSLMPASWGTLAVVATMGFGLGSLGTTVTDGWASDVTPARVSVPAVAGTSAADARALLVQTGLTVVRVNARSAAVPNGMAFQTSPPRGTEVRRGTRVTLFVSVGSPGRVVRIPAVRGLPERDARALLTHAGVAAQPADAPSTTVPRGTAIRTSPRRGAKVRRGSTVTLFVSTGSPGRVVRIPAVRGLPAREARARLEDLGLRVRRREAPSEDIRRGAATGTSPRANRTVDAGSRVTLLVSGGAPGAKPVLVPSVSDLSEREALARLRKAGLDPTARPQPSDAVPAGGAIATDPPAGERVDRGTRVVLRVSSGSRVKPVEVPSLVGDSVDDARQRLEDLGLRADPTLKDSSAPAGTVLQSDPKAHSSVQVGTTVRLTVSTGNFVRVPHVVGATNRDAQRALTDAGLRPAFTGVESDQTTGTVLRTDPPADTDVPRGTRVDVSYSCNPQYCPG